MQDYRKDEIIYDEDWQTFDNVQKCEVVPPQPQSESDNKDENKNIEIPIKKHRTVSLITIQLLLCLIIAFVVFILKSMDSDFYNKISDWYNSMMRYTLVSNETFESIDLSSYFESTSDQLSASNDEV